MHTYFPVLTPSDAPTQSQEALQRLQASVGRLPNLAAIMSASPALIEGFVAIRTLFHSISTLSAHEREIVLLTNAVENGCGYCTAVHTAFSLHVGVPSETVDAVRAMRLPSDAKLAQLVAFNRHLIRQRGQVGRAEFEAFMLAGYSSAQALELLTAAALSTMANYTGRLTHPPLDEFLSPHRVQSESP